MTLAWNIQILLEGCGFGATIQVLRSLLLNLVFYICDRLGWNRLCSTEAIRAYIFGGPTVIQNAVFF